MSQPLRRLGLISDVHCEDAYLAIAIGHLQREGCDALLCVGDLADGRGDLNRVCDLLREHNVKTVRGNHDRWLMTGEARDWPEAVQPEDVAPRTWEFLQALPTSLPIETVAGKLLLCHGMGDNDWGRLEPNDEGYALRANLDLARLHERQDIAFVVAGHTHRPMVRRFAREDGAPLTIINIGQLKHAHGPVFAWGDFASGLVRFWAIESDAVVPRQVYNWKDIEPEAVKFL
jgi:predicted phosphodiesterase